MLFCHDVLSCMVSLCDAPNPRGHFFFATGQVCRDREIFVVRVTHGQVLLLCA